MEWLPLTVIGILIIILGAFRRRVWGNSIKNGIKFVPFFMKKSFAIYCQNV